MESVVKWESPTKELNYGYRLPVSDCMPVMGGIPYR
jgi:hypothetical protein